MKIGDSVYKKVFFAVTRLVTYNDVTRKYTELGFEMVSYVKEKLNIVK